MVGQKHRQFKKGLNCSQSVCQEKICLVGDNVGPQLFFTRDGLMKKNQTPQSLPRVQ